MSCRAIKGWPKFNIEVRNTDFDGRTSLLGYGIASIPFKVGHSKLSIKCWRPTESLDFNYNEYFLGNHPEFIDKSAVYTNDDRFEIYGKSTATVTIEIDIIMKDFNLHGINC